MAVPKTIDMELCVLYPKLSVIKCKFCQELVKVPFTVEEMSWIGVKVRALDATYKRFVLHNRILGAMRNHFAECPEWVKVQVALNKIRRGDGSRKDSGSAAESGCPLGVGLNQP